MDAWIFYSGYIYEKKIESGYIEEIEKMAKEKYNINLKTMNVHEFSLVCENGNNNLYYKGELVKEFPKYAILRRYEIYLGRQLELNGVKVFNNVQAMIDARNKMKTHQYLSRDGVSTPKTIYIVPKNVLTNVYYCDVCKQLGNTKFVVKWLYGSQGKYVHLVDNENDFNKLVYDYKGKIICQEFIEDSFGMDIRAYIIGGKYVGAAIRKSNSGNFRSNLAQGGEAIKYEYNKEVEEIAVKAAKSVNLEICGVDILVGKDKYYVCEVNALPGFKSIYRTSGINEKDILLTLIRDKMDESE